MKKALAAALAASTFITAVQAQGIPPATSAPPPPPLHSPGQSPMPTGQMPQRGNIAPILDIRIEGEGVSLPKPREEPPQPEKPPAK
jgi:hypothetical protein